MTPACSSDSEIEDPIGAQSSESRVSDLEGDEADDAEDVDADHGERCSFSSAQLFFVRPQPRLILRIVSSSFA
jgi:hypothetical protein